MIKDGVNCHRNHPEPSKYLIHWWAQAIGLFVRIRIGFAGRFKCLYYLPLVYANTKCPEVQKCREIFFHFGIRQRLASDHGPQ